MTEENTALRAIRAAMPGYTGDPQDILDAFLLGLRTHGENIAQETGKRPDKSIPDIVTERLGRNDPDEDIIEFGSLRLDRLRRQSWLNGREIHLTAAEFDLAAVLVASAGALVSYQQLAKKVWEDDSVPNSTVHARVKLLREKISRPSNSNVEIRNVHSLGYYLGIRGDDTAG